jgi:hypothetical protein
MSLELAVRILPKLLHFNVSSELQQQCDMSSIAVWLLIIALDVGNTVWCLATERPSAGHKQIVPMRATCRLRGQFRMSRNPAPGEPCPHGLFRSRMVQDTIPRVLPWTCHLLGCLLGRPKQIYASESGLSYVFGTIAFIHGSSHLIVTVYGCRTTMFSTE